MLLEDPPAVAVADMLPEIYLETRPPQAVGPVPEVPVAEVQIPQAGLPELRDSAAGEGQAFLDPGKASLISILRAQELYSVVVG